MHTRIMTASAVLALALIVAPVVAAQRVNVTFELIPGAAIEVGSGTDLND